MDHPPLPTRKGERTALRILDVAEALFAEKGYAGTTLRDVAAGVAMVSAAGGTVSNLSGGAVDLSRGLLLASNGAIHDEVLARLGESSGRDGRPA